MRFRDWFTWICICGVAGAVLWGTISYLNGSLFTSKEINREDARRDAATILKTDEWTEFQIVPGASTFRLLTNAALSSVDAPDYDLSNPRLGWQYSIDYELLDANRNLIEKSDYHFRSPIRQLLDVETNTPIYPMFFGETSLVSTQTRAMQIAIHRKNRDVAIVRAKLKSKDRQISEIVARALARVERKNYDKRRTWNRMSKQRRLDIAKYCVYEQNLLTVAERSSLLRWRWTRCPTIGAYDNRYLFFIGDIDDLEIRDEQIPIGLYVDAQKLGTIPVPEGHSKVRLEFQRLDAHEYPGTVDIHWFGTTTSERKSIQHRLEQDPSPFEMDVNGGTLEFESSDRIVVRAFWLPGDAIAQSMAEQWQSMDRFLVDIEEDDFEITPLPVMVRTFLVDQTPLEYEINHHQDQPTPFRIQVRYPLAILFENVSMEQALEGIQQLEPSSAEFQWEFLDLNGQVVNKGSIEFEPEISSYDWLNVNGNRELVSDAQQYFFSVPTHVAKVRFRSTGSRVLIHAFVRPGHFEKRIRVPEDYHSFNRIQSKHRTWFTIGPPDSLDRIRDNRSFLIATQVRPPETDPEIAEGNYQWFRFTPTANWIGRQILIPKSSESVLQIREQAINASYFELPANQESQYTHFDTSKDLQQKLVFSGEQPPGKIEIIANGETLKQLRLLNRRGTIDLSRLDWPACGTIKIQTEQPARFFITGLNVDAPCFLMRTAQRMRQGSLTFEFEKTSADDELITIRLYRDERSPERSQLRVQIQPPESAQPPLPSESWTVGERVYDLRAMSYRPSLLLGNEGRVDTGSQCFIKLGNEMPKGVYRFIVSQIEDESTDNESECLVLMYQTVAGHGSIRKLNVSSKLKVRP